LFERGIVNQNEIVGFKVLLFGDDKLCDFYNLFFSKSNIESVLYSRSKPEELKSISFGILFSKGDIHSAEDSIKDIKQRLGANFKILPVFEKKDYYVLESMFSSGIERIC